MKMLLAVMVMLASLVQLAWPQENAKDSEGLMNKLLAPGPLIDGHKTLEDFKCTSCHVPGKGISEERCLSCHKEINKSRKDKTTFHGQTQKTCWQCHSDHKGRDFDTTQVDVKTFDHATTGFKLGGKHADLKCAQCHTEKRVKKDRRPDEPRFFGKTSTCVSCHKKDDSHLYKGKWAKKDCSSCHGAGSWTEGVKNFDHDKDTAYALTGKHEGLKCAKCHEQGVYKWPQLKTKTCQACHDSPHTKTFPKALQAKTCTECHVTDGWRTLPKGAKGTGFDHGAATRFRLTGRHAELSCKKCHVVEGKAVYKFGGHEKGYCNSCHVNVHVGQFSEKFASKSCAECHNTKSFSKVVGLKNADLKGGRALAAAPSSAEKSFNHDETRLPLLDAHQNVKCEKCHVATDQMLKTKPPRPMHKFQFPELAQQSCATCHSDPHRGSMGSASCSECHNEKGWGFVRNFHEHFTLGGVHRTLECSQCHKGDRRLTGMSTNCVLCHRKDDVHNGTLPECNRCHKQDSWPQSDFKHTMTRFPLKGAHRTTDCAACHVRGVYQGTPRQCVECHFKDVRIPTFPVHTLPQFENCARCHNPFSFARARQ